MSKGRRLDNGRYGQSYSQELSKVNLQQSINKGLSAYQIAEAIGCSPKTVYSYIEYHKIKYEDKRITVKPGIGFGLLTTIHTDGKSKNGTFYWKCRCSCGNITRVIATSLKNGRIKSCGCWRKRKRNHRWKGYCGISGTRISEIRLRARKKKMEFSLTPKILWELWEKQRGKCAISGIDIDLDATASVDRIDSNGGYILSNVQWVHKDINKMKMDIQMDQFIKYCNTISSHNKEQK